MKFTWIKEQRGRFPLRRMCRLLGVSKSGFYAWLKRPISGLRRRRAELAAAIRSVHRENRGVYGSPRVQRVLLAEGKKVCRNTVASIMREHDIRARRRKRYVPRTTDSSHDYAPAANLLDRQFSAAGRDCKWAADITYIPSAEGWLFLAAVIDLHSRRIVGWSMSDHMKVDLVADALAMAIARRRPGPGLLHHSDRGVQYACDDYQELLARSAMRCSMSGKGNCYDNAVMESFWATLKSELVHQAQFPTHQAARAALFEYIEVFYNRKRLHSSLGYLSPEAFEAGRN
jgi:putative transposase